MNIITVFGRLTDIPEMKTSQDNKAIAKFTLADNRGQDKASFFRCTAFGKTAELIGKCQKADRLVVSGRMEEQEWNDQQGQKQRGWQLIVSEMSYVEAASQNTNQSPAQQGYGHPPAGYPQPGPQYQAPPQNYAPPTNGYPPQYNAPQAAPAPYSAPTPQYGAPPAGQPQYQAPPQYQQPPQYSQPAQPQQQQGLPFNAPPNSPF